MIRILKQRVMNFASYVSPAIPYDGETTLIGGPNGAGKSTFIEAMRYALGNADLQHGERHKEYYTRDHDDGRHKYTASTITFSNRTSGGKPDVFLRIGIREPVVTLGVVYVPKPEGKQPRYHVMAGDVAMKDFVEETTAKGTSRKDFRAKLETCLLTQSVIEHVFVKQGTAGEYAKKSPRDLYVTVLSQSGHEETKTQYEAAAADCNRTHQQLQRRELEAKQSKLDLRDAQQSVDALDAYEAKERELAHLDLEEQARQFYVLGRERRTAMEELQEAQRFIGDAPGQIGDLASQISAEEDHLTELRRRVHHYEVDRKVAENARDEARDAKKAAETEMQEAVERHTTWLRVRYAPHSEEAQARYDAAWQNAAQRQAAITSAESERDRVKQIIEDLRAGSLHPPRRIAAILEAVRSHGIEVEVLANILGAQNGLVEAALAERVWSITCRAGDVDAVAKILHAQECTTPVVALGNEYWAHWVPRGGFLETPFGVIASPAPEPRLLVDRSEARLQELGRAAARLDIAVQDAEVALVEARQAVKEATRSLEDAKTRAELGEDAPDKDPAQRAFAQASTEYDAARVAFEEVKRNTPERLHVEINAREDEVAPKREKLVDLQTREDAAKAAVEEYPDRIKGLDARLAALDDLPPEYQEQARDLDAPMRRQHEIEREAKMCRRYLAEHAKPDADVRFRASNLQDRYDDLERRIKETRSAYEGTVKALEEAQVKYGQTANAAMDAFKKRFEAVSNSFHVKPKVAYTKITPNLSIDEINAATLDITVQFGDKPPLKLRGGLSGGEGAVAGLLLRLCMMNNDATGFFVVDEPYQSLDDRNVRLIAEFLEKSEYQVIMIVPNSQDPNQYRGALRGIRVRPAGPDGMSPVPDVIGIKRTGDVLVAA